MTSLRPPTGPVNGSSGERDGGGDSAQLRLVSAIARIVEAPLSTIVAALSDAVSASLPHQALVVLTQDCTGRPQKKAGDPEITEKVTVLEMDAIRRRLRDGEEIRSAVLAGRERDVRAWEAATGAVLALCGTGAASARPAEALIQGLWEITATSIRRQVDGASPAELVDANAVSTERVRVTTELTERHATDLESLLAVLRSRDLDDRRTRVSATELASSALVRTRTANDVMMALSEEPVVSAFSRLRTDLRPLTQYGRLDVQFIEPPAKGRALPGEVAHAARSIVRSAVLAMNEQEDISRVRVQWDCDGKNLLINIRDDGPGAFDSTTPGLHQAQANVAALGGEVGVKQVPGWGTELDVRLPIDASRSEAVDEWNLAPREREVLRLVVHGKKNRQIAQELFISENTVKFHLTQIYRKLGVGSRSAAAAVAAAGGLV
ncbi:LuxR C-terminal-related transcriptional regulator [Zhihengliuella halotolerans]|uniref:LuxR C-terminal-related transcriptional regulator n=1 Tax=Zhihengliuella halotolerans TaxID=370736 RepID=UPI0027E56053|nr:LuxR C-terminal-related transcriptional regulator [Zhihengliuella halotolerans]